MLSKKRWLDPLLAWGEAAMIGFFVYVTTWLLHRYVHSTISVELGATAGVAFLALVRHLAWQRKVARMLKLMDTLIALEGLEK